MEREVFTIEEKNSINEYVISDIIDFGRVR